MDCHGLPDPQSLLEGGNTAVSLESRQLAGTGWYRYPSNSNGYWIMTFQDFPVSDLAQKFGVLELYPFLYPFKWFIVVYYIPIYTLTIAYYSHLYPLI